MADFEVTPEGLETPRLPEVRELIVLEWKGVYGVDPDTGSDTPDGLMIDVLAIIHHLLWEATSQVYNNSFLRTSTGIAVDLILDQFARKRLKALASTVSAIWYGDDAKPVPPGSIASVATSSERFSTATVVTTGAGDLLFVARIQNAEDTETYTVTVDGTPEAAVAGPSDTPLTLAVTIADQITLGPSPAIGTAIGVLDENGFGLVIIESAVAITVVATATGTGLIDDKFGARAAMTATVTGPISALSGTLTGIETPLGGIAGVVNDLDATIGRNLETDPEYKQRHFLTINAQGCGTVQAIEARVLTTVPDIESVKVFENDTDAIDAEGRNPHSFETFAVGGTDEDVARAILECKPAGIETVGDISVLLPETTKPIFLSRPTEGFLHLDIVVTPGEGFPTTGDPVAAIVASVTAFLGKGGPGELKQGIDLYRFQLAEPINAAVAGIASAVIETDDTPLPGDAPAFTASDIIVADDEILISDSGRITVTIV